MKYYIVKYSGPFGFIKPWTAVRDSETFSQQFLTPSIVEGMEKKLFPELLGVNGIQKIVGHRLSYSQVTGQQEVIQTRGWNSKRKGQQFLFERPTSIMIRGILLKPALCLAFKTKLDAKTAFVQHLCLCRNEDLLFPKEIMEVEEEEFNTNEELFAGYELVFEKNEKSFLVGYHRVTQQPMYGWIKIVGQPLNIF